MKKEIKKEEPKKEPKKKVTMFKIYDPQKYKDCDLFIQKVGYSAWQWIIFRQGKFYSDYIVVRPKKIKWLFAEPYTKTQEMANVKWCMIAAKTTVDTLEKLEKDELDKVNKKWKKKHKKSKLKK